MYIRQLQEFVDLVQTSNFQKTAENMNTSQPCISKHIQMLEEELGVELFDRASRIAKLNKYGVSFAAYAKQIVELNNEAISELNEIKSADKNSLSVGFHPMLGQYGLVELISSFNDKHPEIPLNLIESNNLEEILKTHQCDVVFAPEDELVSPDLQRVLYMRDWLVVVCSENHSLAKEDVVQLPQLQNENFIAHSKSNGGLHTEAANFLRICREHGGFTPKIVATVSMTATVAKFVSQGKGIALLLHKHLPGDIPRLKTVDIQPEVPVNIYAFYLKNKKLSAPMAAFLEFMESFHS